LVVFAAPSGWRAAGETEQRRKPEALGQLSSDEGEEVVQGVGYVVIGAGWQWQYKLGKPSHYA